MRREIVRNNTLYQRLRGACQDASAARNDQRYRRLANRSGIRIPKEQELGLLVRELLARRPHPPWPKRAGEMHVFLPFTVSNWEFILPHALAVFGRVTTFDWRDYGYDDRVGGWTKIRDQMNTEMLRVFWEANSSQPVDAICGYLSGFHVSKDVLAEMRSAGAAVFNICWDDILHFPGKKRGGRYISPAAIANSVDLNLTNSPRSVIKYMVHGGLALFSPEAAHPEVHRPHASDFLYDVTFVGANYGRRHAFISTLRRRGIRVECFGPNWPSGALADADMVGMYSKSRINLGFSRVGYSAKLSCLKGRDFEVPMSGGLYLTQWNPDLELVFNVGKEILTYRNARDCAETIRKILRNPEWAEQIRASGRARCLADHTYETRWTRVFVLAGILKEVSGGN